MYNEGLKINFIRNYTQSINTANVATTVFTAFEPHEEAWVLICVRKAPRNYSL